MKKIQFTFSIPLLRFLISMSWWWALITGMVSFPLFIIRSMQGYARPNAFFGGDLKLTFSSMGEEILNLGGGKTNPLIIFGFIFVSFAAWGVFFAVVYQLRKIFKTPIEQHPFGFNHSVRIQRIAQIIVGWFLVRYFLTHSLVYSLSMHFRPGVRPPSQDLISSDLLLGLLILVLAEIIRYGENLQSEHDMTI